jgi:protein-L-isoaspartate(D-aspartate) O-methyltransferase
LRLTAAGVPVGHGQTISQPFIVVLMSDLLGLQPDHVVLEIGAGSGYQATILSQLVSKVFTVEIIPELGQQGAERLRRAHATRWGLTNAVRAAPRKS